MLLPSVRSRHANLLDDLPGHLVRVGEQIVVAEGETLTECELLVPGHSEQGLKCPVRPVVGPSVKGVQTLRAIDEAEVHVCLVCLAVSRIAPRNPLHAARQFIDCHRLSETRPVGGGEPGATYDLLDRVEGCETALEFNLRGAGDKRRPAIPFDPGAVHKAGVHRIGTAAVCQHHAVLFRCIAEQAAHIVEAEGDLTALDFSAPYLFKSVPYILKHADHDPRRPASDLHLSWY